jgi:hypothetical protein
MSRHLRALRNADWVAERHGGVDARVRIYKQRPEPIADLAVWLRETQAMWVDQLTAFKDHMGARGDGE